MDACSKCAGAHSATSAHVDLAVDNNATWQDAFQFGDPDDTSWSLAGCTFKMDVQQTVYDAVPRLALSSTAGQIVIADTVQRVIYLNVPDTLIQMNLPQGEYVYDLIMIDASSVRTPLMHGTVCVATGVTG